ncbi:hypothetical protein CF70_018170 [Cupriavidus sp. SK-3]|nr:hypothetical protein CF70_018170 [Cupriavidus sp. SK-3]
MEKVGVVLPKQLRHHLDLARLWAPDDHARESISIDQAALRHAIRDQNKIRFAYQDIDGQSTVRVVRPLIMAFYGPVWLLAAWCEMRDGFRVFRLDRMTELSVLDATFEDTPGRTAEDFLKQDAARNGDRDRRVKRDTAFRQGGNRRP